MTKKEAIAVLNQCARSFLRMAELLEGDVREKEFRRNADSLRTLRRLFFDAPAPGKPEASK